MLERLCVNRSGKTAGVAPHPLRGPRSPCSRWCVLGHHTALVWVAGPVSGSAMALEQLLLHAPPRLLHWEAWRDRCHGPRAADSRGHSLRLWTPAALPYARGRPKAHAHPSLLPRPGWQSFQTHSLPVSSPNPLSTRGERTQRRSPAAPAGPRRPHSTASLPTQGSSHGCAGQANGSDVFIKSLTPWLASPVMCEALWKL